MKASFDPASLDEFPDAVMATTREGKVFYWDRAAEGLLGHPENKVRAQGRLFIFHSHLQKVHNDEH